MLVLLLWSNYLPFSLFLLHYHDLLQTPLFSCFLLLCAEPDVIYFICLRRLLNISQNMLPRSTHYKNNFWHLLLVKHKSWILKGPYCLKCLLKQITVCQEGTVTYLLKTSASSEAKTQVKKPIKWCYSGWAICISNNITFNDNKRFTFKSKLPVL